MNQTFPSFAHGRNCFPCLVCDEEKARVALQVRGKLYGLCPDCIDHPRRDALLSSVLPHGISACDPEISDAWRGVVHAAWDIARDSTPAPNRPMQFIDASGSRDPTDRFDFGLG